MQEYEYVERGIHVFELIGNIGFREIKQTLDFIKSLRQRNPRQILHDIGSNTDYLYMADNGERTGNLWIKFGWARRRGLPEKLDVSQGQIEVLRLPDGVYIYEPSHFVIFQHDGRVFLLQEFNFFGPRVIRLCEYILKFYNDMTNIQNARLKPRRVFRGDVERLLREYSIISSISIRIEPSALNKLSRVLGGSETALDVLRGLSPKQMTITWSSGKNSMLELTIDDLLDIFHVETHVSSFKVVVKRSRFGRGTKFDLKKDALIFRKFFRCVQDGDEIYRSTDTHYAVEVLLDTINEVRDNLSSS